MCLITHVAQGTFDEAGQLFSVAFSPQMSPARVPRATREPWKAAEANANI